MMTLGIILMVLLLVDGLRLRFRIQAFRTASAATDSNGEGVCFLTAPGVSLPTGVRQCLIAELESQGLDALDAIPQRWHSLGALSLAQLVEPTTYRKTRLAKGRTAGVAIAVRNSVLVRAGFPAEDQCLTPPQMAAAARRLKLYTCTTTDFAVVPGLQQRDLQLTHRKATLRESIGALTWLVLIGQPAIFGGLIAFAIVSPLWGGMTLGVFHLQPMMSLAFGPIRAWDMGLHGVGRIGIELWIWLATLSGSAPAPDRHGPVEAKRPTYAQWTRDGLDSFFESRQTQCPLCGAATLKPMLQTSDLVQRKPGRFTLEQCGECRHVFQNPRLNLAGLNYYYADFYDGLGEEGVEAIFGYSAEPYWTRARMVQGHTEPTRWLDVGAGHGHFCCTARDIFPTTSFDALDLSESVEEAVRRGWADEGIRGLFPDVAPSMSERYDVVSMSHYLEHTREPIQEIHAAHRALKPNGVLLIEVPDPECSVGHFLGRWWLPWFQPQHQHLLSTGNLEKLLRTQGFESLVWHTGEAHQPVDFLFATYLQIKRMAPLRLVPWSPRLRAGTLLLHQTIWILGAPWIASGWLLDRLMHPFMKRAKHSNTYRVIARKTEAQVDQGA